MVIVALSAALLLAAPPAAAELRPVAAQTGGAQTGGAQTAKAENPIAREPLYADIVRRASALRDQVQAYRTAPAPAAALPAFERFKADIAALAALDMKGHFDLARRGTDGDLKCILKGISEDLPKKLAELEQAGAPDARATALEDMFYLLRDNVEVVTAPPAVQS